MPIQGAGSTLPIRSTQQITGAPSSSQQPAVKAHVSSEVVGGVASGSDPLASLAQPIMPKAEGRLRDNAAALAQKFQQNPSNLLALHTEQLALQGQLLRALPNTDYENVVGSLHENLEATHAHENAQLEIANLAALETMAPLAQPESGKINTKQISDALNEQAAALAEHLQVTHSRYEEALKTPNLPTAQKRDIEHSRKAFVDYALRAGTHTERMLTEGIKTFKERTDALQAQADDVKKTIDGAAPGKANEETVAEHKKLLTQIESWKSAGQAIEQVKKDYKPPAALAGAIHNARLPQVLAEFEKQSSFFNKFLATLPKALQQFAASLLHFGFTRAAIESALRMAKFGARVTGSGAGLGVAHEAINGTIRPLVNELMTSLTRREVRLVDFAEVSSHPSEQYTVNGVQHKRTPVEMADAKKHLAEFKERFSLAQNNHKFGTMKGEGAFFFGFGIAQAALELLVDTGVLPAKTIPFLALASAIGGAISASLQTGNQLGNTVMDDHGRMVRTHVPVGIEKALPDRLKKVAEDSFKALDVRNPKVQEAFLSKAYGAMQGVAISTAVSDQVKGLDPNKASHAALKVLVSSVGPTLTLSSFFAAMQTAPEAKKGGTGRMGDVGNNLLAPDRDTLEHTTPKDSKMRSVEKGFHRVRGGLQVPSQTATVITAGAIQGVLHPSATLESLANTLGSFTSMMRGTPSTSQENQMEMGQMGQSS